MATTKTAAAMTVKITPNAKGNPAGKLGDGLGQVAPGNVVTPRNRQDGAQHLFVRGDGHWVSRTDGYQSTAGFREEAGIRMEVAASATRRDERRRLGKSRRRQCRTSQHASQQRVDRLTDIAVKHWCERGDSAR
jgi:hypothetical protein